MPPVAAAAGAVLGSAGVTAAVAVAGAAYSYSYSRRVQKKAERDARKIAYQMSQDTSPIGQVIYGGARVSGPLAFHHKVKSGSAEYHYLVIILSCHKLSEITDDVWVGDDHIQLSGGAATGKYANYLWVTKHLGDDDQAADSMLIAETGGLWTTNHRLRGLGYVVVKMKYNKDKFPRGLENLSFFAFGKPLYDPRTDATAHSHNLALMVNDYLSDDVFGMQATIPFTIKTSATIAAANICDEPVGMGTSLTKSCDVEAGTWNIGFNSSTPAGLYIGLPVAGTHIPAGSKVSYIDPAGLYFSINKTPSTGSWPGPPVTLTFGDSEPRYEGSHVFLTDLEPREVLSSLLDAMAGVLIPINGEWVIKAGAYDTPTIELGYDDLADGMSIELADPIYDAVNRVQGEFVSPKDNYSLKPFPPVKNDTYLTQDGGIEYPLDLSFPCVQSPSQAQRLGKIALERARQGMVIRFPGNLRTLNVVAGINVMVTSPKHGWNQKVFEVLESTPYVTDTGRCGQHLLLRETASGVWDWNSGEETTVDLAPNTDNADPWTTNAPTNLTLASGTNHLVMGGDGTIVSRIFATWDQADSDYITTGGGVEVEYKKSADSTWLPVGLFSGVTSQAYVSPVVDGTNYDVRVRFLNPLGVRSDWTTSSNHTVIGKTAIPGSPSNLTATGQVEAIFLQWDNDDDVDIAATQIYEGDTTSKPGFVSFTVPSVPSGTGSFMRGGLAGGATKYYWIEHLDSSGNVGNSIGPVSATALAPSGGTQGPAGEDGDPGVFGFITHDNVLGWSRAINSGVWSPTDYTTEITATFKQGETVLGTRVITATLNPTTGNITLGSGSGAGITESVVGSGTPSVSIVFTHTASGTSTGCTLFSVQGGNNGVNGVSGQITTSNTNNWVRAPDGGSWAPNSSGTTLTATFYRDGASIATRTLAVSFNSSTGALTATGGTVSGITATVTGSGTTSMTVVFAHDESGASTSVLLTAVAGGSTGPASTAYWLVSAAAAIQKSQAGAYTPANLVVSSISQTGASAPAAYSGRFVIATSTDGSSYVDQYSSASNESSHSFTVPANIKSIRVRLYQAGGFTNLLDEEIVPVVVDGSDGSDGSDGANAISSTLSNDAHVLPADASGNVTSFAGAVTTMSVYNGATDDSGNWTFSQNAVNCSATATNSNRTATITGMAADTAYVDITATRSGYATQVRRFSLSKSRAGTNGTDGSDGQDGATGATGGSGNVHFNSDFSVPDSGGTRAFGFAPYNNSGISTSYVYGSDPAISGKHFGVRANASGASQFGIYSGYESTVGAMPAWQLNKTYVISVYARKANGAGWTGVSLAWNTHPASTTALVAPTLSTSWQRYAWKITWGASVESEGRLYLTREPQSGSANGDEIHFSNLQVEEGEVLNGWRRRTDAAPGPSLRGQYNAATVYYYNEIRRDLVLSGGVYYQAVNATKSGTASWGTPGSSADWMPIGATFDSIATGLLLTQQATIAQTLVMGDGATQNAGIIRSAGATAFGTGAGYWMNPRNGSNLAEFRVGDPAGSRFQYDGTTAALYGGVMDVGSGLLRTRIDSDGVVVGYGGNTRLSLVSWASGSTLNEYANTSANASLNTVSLRSRYYSGGAEPVKAHGSLGLVAEENSSSSFLPGGLHLVVGSGIGLGYLSGITLKYYGDSAERFIADAGGHLYWGPGNASYDAQLYRESANQLRLQGGRLHVAGSGYTANPDGIVIGQYSSTAGYIQAPNGGYVDIWKSNGDAIVRFSDNGITQAFGPIVTSGIGPRIYTYLSSGANSGVGVDMSGSGYELSLFSGGASDSNGRISFGRRRVDTGTYVQHVAIPNIDGFTFGSAEDTNLYRYAADGLKTDDSFWVGATLVAGGGIIYVGSAGDASIYRQAAGVVRTDGTFRALAYQDNDGNQLLTSRQSAIANLGTVYTPTGTYSSDASAIRSGIADAWTKINSILSMLRTHGLIAT